jgi:hypothetical protein
MWMFTTLAAAFGADIDAVTVDVGKQSTGVVEGVVDATIAEIVGLVMDCAGADAWFPDLKETEVVSEQAGVVTCSGKTDLPWPIPDRVWHIASKVKQVGPSTWEIPFALVPATGNLVDLHGGYRLEDLGGGRTFVHYDATVDLGFWIPDPLVEWATKRVLPAILEGLEDAADARDGLVASL